ncbi:Z-DNA-binding protein 1 [Artibeus jamaicensis]|uniref:Z-DNA-binding protein 1 n=1 Tax=Artibeus jamaicensis TaxID=9417 RepID=UPI00235A7BC2|nr:Z-DNA-binding protein 1 [Artibeus jamaicensis]
MAEASADPGETDLEQKILQVLREDGSPVKTAKLVKECQVPKKKLNQVLYRMKEESRVALAGTATWQLGGPGTGELVCTELAPACSAEKPQQPPVAAPLKLSCQLSERQEQIYRFLEANGPSRALIIAQSLGLKTAKEVNPDLYALRNKHFLNYDQNSNAWAVYKPEDSRERSQATNIIYQQNPINMICQNGPNSHISIENSEAVQIGHGNSIVRQTAHGDNSSMAPLCLPPPAPADPSTQDPLAASWGSQDIHLEKSVLRRVQLGHGNEMSLPDALATRPDRGPSVNSFSVSPPGEHPARLLTGWKDPQLTFAGRESAEVPGRCLGGLKAGLGGLPLGPAQLFTSHPASLVHGPTVSATTADPEASFEIRMPTLEPQTEGDGDMTQRVLMKSCLLEDATIGNSNRMRVGRGEAGPGGGAGLEDSSWDSREPAGEPADGKAPQSEAAEPSSKIPQEGRQAGSNMATITAHLEALTLESRGPDATEDGPLD